jgi:glycerol-3-phosphate dehydrogenase
MRPTLKPLAEETFELLIVGAGIHGASAAWTASRMGLKTALIDAGDFGGATSANSLKIIHGGLRYLQHGNISRMRESIRARRRFLALAPQCVSPLPCAVPTRGCGIRSRAAMRLALALNDLISCDRNRGLPPASALPRGRILDRDAARAIWPQLPRDAYDGAAVWHDGLAHDIERLTLSFVLAAAARGAHVANYVRATSLVQDAERLHRVSVRDEIGGDSFDIRARAVINAAGPWWQRWAPLREPLRPLVGAWNLVVRRRIFETYAVGLERAREHHDADAIVRRGKRNLFFVPWRGGTMIGTVYEPFAGDPADYRPSADAVSAFIGEINALLPGIDLKPEDIALLHSGVQPAPSRDGSPEPDKHSEIIEGPAPGLFSIKGVKYTTGLTVGERAACMAARRLGRSGAPPADEPLPAPPDDGRDLQLLVCRAVQQEYAVRLADVVFRRSTLGAFGLPDPAVQTALARLMGDALGWTDARRAAELAHLAAREDVPLISCGKSSMLCKNFF